MNWERRGKSGRRYYCRSVRRGGKVTSVYLGNQDDPLTRAIAAAESLLHARSATALAEVRAEQAVFRQLEPMFAAIADHTRREARIHILAHGFRQLKGRWTMTGPKQRRRGHDPTADKDLPPRELIDHLGRRAARGDRTAAERLRKLIREHPEIWQPVGDLTQHAAISLIGLVAGDNAVLQESVLLQVERLRDSLSGGITDDPLDRLLVDQVVVCWLELEYTRLAAIQPQAHFKDATFWQRRHRDAHARYLGAVRELIAARKLLGGEIDDVNAWITSLHEDPTANAPVSDSPPSGTDEPEPEVDPTQ